MQDGVSYFGEVLVERAPFLRANKPTDLTHTRNGNCSELGPVGELVGTKETGTASADDELVGHRAVRNLFSFLHGERALSGFLPAFLQPQIIQKVAHFLANLD